MKKKPRRLSVYFASELFSVEHLVGNAYLAEAIYEKSHGRFLCRLPQDFELRGLHPQTIRDQGYSGPLRVRPGAVQLRRD
jgi:hypothetical protein